VEIRLHCFDTQGIEPEVRTFNTVIIACNMSGQAAEALKVYERMLNVGAQPTATTYTALIRCAMFCISRTCGPPDRHWSAGQAVLHGAHLTCISHLWCQARRATQALQVCAPQLGP